MLSVKALQNYPAAWENFLYLKSSFFAAPPGHDLSPEGNLHHWSRPDIFFDYFLIKLAEYAHVIHQISGHFVFCFPTCWMVNFFMKLRAELIR